ncbi:hypothetical protein FRB95_006081 [Tulasnella sp. JGI-2019a]|nr:hypothetical protein FRB95_006081 [Tulasnella sp. JGI-2019a]
MHLLNLPTELLILLPALLESLQDLHALTLTCRALSNIPTLISNDILVRLALSPHTGLQPYPHLLLATKARKLADWAVQDDSRRKELLEAIKGGCESVLQLGLKISPLTLNDLRCIHTTRFNILIPLSEELDPTYGPKSGHLTFCNNLVLALTNFWIYCDLFHHNISEGCRPSLAKPLSALTRRLWFRFCVPDMNCNPDLYGQFEQLDLKQFLYDLQAEALKIATDGATTEYTEQDTWTARCVFYTGLPALTLLKARSPALTDLEIVHLTEEKIREGEYPYGDAGNDEPDAWESMNEDIRWSWYGEWESEDVT